MDRKRGAEHQITADHSDNDDRGNEEFITTPQRADVEEMSTRRVVRVVRAQPASAPSSGSTGLFKNLLSSTSTSAAATAAGSTAAFSTTLFGTNLTPMPASTSISTRASSSTAPANPFAAKPAVFGSGFNFSSAVNTFVEARKRMEEERDQKTADAAPQQEGSGNDDEKKEEEDGEEDAKAEEQHVFGGATTMVASTGEVLAVAPAKVFRLNNKDGTVSWVECGEGDAKVKRETLSPATEDKAATFAYRVVVRDGYTLNAPLGKGMLLVRGEQAKQVTLSMASVTDGLQTYTLRFTGPAAEANAKKFIEELKKAMKAAEEGK